MAYASTTYLCVYFCETNNIIFQIWITSQIIVEFMRRLNNYSFELDPNDFPNLYDLNFTINDRFTPKISRKCLIGVRIHFLIKRDFE